jgi:predicted metal-dependent phosphoesterase TrpH
MNRFAATRMRFYERRGGPPRGSRAGVSLHCHTQYSKELLTFIPHYAAMIPAVSRMFRSEMSRYLTIHGKTIDFARAWWTPPVAPLRVFESETLQIEKEFGLPAFVSITDHDNIESGLALKSMNSGRRIPISVEWTVPYRRGFFHLGVHNLPPDGAREIADELLKYAERTPDAMTLGDLLAWLNESPGVLIVLNHPMRDLEFIGAAEHADFLKAFLADHIDWIHAFEFNGFRPWKENEEVRRLAEDFGLPVVAGGDRHGLQPNTLLNLTRAGSFDEYVAEARYDGHSEILVMPEYGQSLVARTIEVAAETLRNYPSNPEGRRKWTERVHIDIGDGSGSQALARYWKRGGPSWVRASLWVLRALGSHRMNTALRVALAGERVGHET